MSRIRRWNTPVTLASLLVLCSIVPSAAFGQKAMPANADPDWEVASVKATDPTETRGQHINMDGRRVLLLGTTVQQLLLIGYGMQKVQIANIPAWAETQRWDIAGVPDTEGSPSLTQVQTLMRKILAERFGLQLHHEQREIPVFVLTVAKGGSKMVANTSKPNGPMDQRNSHSSALHVENLTNTAISELVLILQFSVNRPIVDQTGLKGRYDLKLEWAPDDAPPSDAADAPPGLFTTIQSQAGLKLQPVKAPADTLVIDAISKPKPD
ncbi:TIGR03435 family protein [Terriglobus roseus]|uniref:TIGR03435 family protein n=1 Tax=Terriglobus roseus TaxID=392734 RepID=UPI00155F9795|nr:TIGR03435 family protein [Terriglobus roseus]